MKNLEHNAWEHSLQFILPIVVAIFVFLTRHVTEPPPELLFRDPVLYVARVQNASGIAMLQFLRHAGLPAMWWQRAARAEDSRTLDDMHALSFHTVCFSLDAPPASPASPPRPPNFGCVLHSFAPRTRQARPRSRSCT